MRLQKFLSNTMLFCFVVTVITLVFAIMILKESLVTGHFSGESTTEDADAKKYGSIMAGMLNSIQIKILF